MKNIRVFLSERFQFLEVKFSIYLNRRVFVMQKVKSTGQFGQLTKLTCRIDLMIIIFISICLLRLQVLSVYVIK